MPLNLYRRHRPDCESGHLAESRSGEFEERKKGWKRCGCMIFASGTLAGRFKRKYTGKSAWDEAKFAFKSLSQSGFNPIGAMAAYLFVGIIRGAAAEDEDESTHPSGPRRFRILFDALQSQTNEADFRSYLRSTGQLDNWSQAMEKMRKFAQQ